MPTINRLGEGPVPLAAPAESPSGTFHAFITSKMFQWYREGVERLVQEHNAWIARQRELNSIT